MFDEWIKNNKKTLIVFTSLIALFLMFQNKIERLFLFIDELMNYETVSFKVGYAIICLVVFLIYVSHIEKKYVYNSNFSFVIILIATCYLITRISTSVLELYPIGDTGLKYLDIIFFILLLYVILLGNNLENDTIKKEEITKENFFIEDSVYVKGEIFNELILKRLLEQTLNFKPKGSFSIGLNAPWGYGKSSFLQRFESEYKKNDNEAVIFWYRIWKNKGSYAIIDNFFKELAISLAPYSGEISNEINNYVKAILHITPDELTKIVEVGKGIFEQERSLEGHYKKVKEDIQKIDRQIIILLDDLDRLEESEILDTYKLIRTLSDFDNVIFIAGYDREYLDKTLGEDKKNFINKIFQVEISLLPFDESIIREELLKEIECHFPEGKGLLNQSLIQGYRQLFSDSTNIQDIDMESILDTDTMNINKELRFNDFITTYRDIKRFINEFKFNSFFIKSNDNIKAQEYILLKLCVFKYRGLQNTLFAKVDNYLSKYSIEEHSNSIKPTSGIFDNIAGVYVYDNNARARVTKLLERQSYPEEDILIIEAVLFRLFFKNSYQYYSDNLNTISRVYNTNMYVRNNVAGGIYTLSHFREVFENSKLQELIKEINGLSIQVSNQVINELKLFLLKIEIDSIKSFRVLIAGLNSINTYYSYNENLKLISIINSVYKQFYKGDKQNLLEDFKTILFVNEIGGVDKLLGEININLARKNKSERQHNATVIHSTNFRNYEGLILNDDDVKTLLLAKYKYIVENKNINLIIEVYTSCLELITQNDKIILIEEANRTFKGDIYKRFEDYYYYGFFNFKPDSANIDTEYTNYYPYPFLFQIFSNLDTLSKLIRNPDDGALFEQFQKEGWDNYCEFLKEHINKKPELEKIIRLTQEFIRKGYKNLNYEEFIDITEIEINFAEQYSYDRLNDLLTHASWLSKKVIIRDVEHPSHDMQTHEFNSLESLKAYLTEIAIDEAEANFPSSEDDRSTYEATFNAEILVGKMLKKYERQLVSLNWI